MSRRTIRDPGIPNLQFNPIHPKGGAAAPPYGDVPAPRLPNLQNNPMHPKGEGGGEFRRGKCRRFPAPFCFCVFPLRLPGAPHRFTRDGVARVDAGRPGNSMSGQDITNKNKMRTSGWFSCSKFACRSGAGGHDERGAPLFRRVLERLLCIPRSVIDGLAGFFGRPLLVAGSEGKRRNTDEPDNQRGSQNRGTKLHWGSLSSGGELPGV